MRTKFGALVLIATGLAACGGSDPTPAYDDVARGLGAMVAEPNGGESISFADAITAAGGEIPLGMQLDDPGKLSGKRGDVEYKFELACRDANGAALTSCQSASSADVKIEWRGKVDDPRYKVELERKADWKTSQLDQPIAHVSGKGDFHTKAELDDTMTKVKYDFDYDADYKDVQVRASDRALVGGELHYDVKAKLHESTTSETIKESYHVKARVSFNDDGTASITLDEKYKYKLELDSGDVEKLSN